MKGNNSIDELLISFLLKELDPAEETFITQQINSDTQIRSRFEELQKTWTLIATKKDTDNINVDEEWQFFQQAIAKRKQQLVPVKANEVPNEIIIIEETTTGSGRLRKIIVSIAIAASFLLAVVFLWQFLSHTGSTQERVSKVPVLTESVVSTLKHEVNYSGKKKKILLADGSQVILENKSEISYSQPFINNRRDITLTGKADFKVAKDKSRPFTVYSMDLSTTALGTHFTVSAFRQEENIIVRLFEGKIVIKSAPGVNNKLDSDYYLVPGQALVYNNKNFTARRSSFSLQDGITYNIADNTKVERIRDDVDLPEHHGGAWYMFNNQSAKQAFEQLKVIYNTDIIYSRKDIRNLYIIIEFNKTDSLDRVLDRIARANNLKVTRENNKFIISR